MLLYILSSILFIALPAFSTFIFYKSNIIQNLNMESKDDRIPSMVLFLFYSITFYYYIKDIDVIQPMVFSFFISIATATLISIILSYFLNLSLHNVALSLLLGMIVSLAQITSENHDLYVYITIGVIGLISSLRLFLEKVDLPNLVISTVLGFACSYLCIVFDISSLLP